MTGREAVCTEDGEDSFSSQILQWMIQTIHVLENNNVIMAIVKIIVGPTHRTY
jgi:hypothetical protein